MKAFKHLVDHLEEIRKSNVEDLNLLLDDKATLEFNFQQTKEKYQSELADLDGYIGDLNQNIMNIDLFVSMITPTVPAPTPEIVVDSAPVIEPVLEVVTETPVVEPAPVVEPTVPEVVGDVGLVEPNPMPEVPAIEIPVVEVPAVEVPVVEVPVVETSVEEPVAPEVVTETPVVEPVTAIWPEIESVVPELPPEEVVEEVIQEVPSTEPEAVSDEKVSIEEIVASVEEAKVQIDGFSEVLGRVAYSDSQTPKIYHGTNEAGETLIDATWEFGNEYAILYVEKDIPTVLFGKNISVNEEDEGGMRYTGDEAIEKLNKWLETK